MKLLVKGTQFDAMAAAIDHLPLGAEVRIEKIDHERNAVSLDVSPRDGEVETAVGKWYGEKTELRRGYGYAPGTLVFYRD